jgi:hypothetical protein
MVHKKYERGAFSMARKPALFVATSVIALWLSDANAAPFGETVILPEGFWQYQQCAPYITLLSAPIEVDVPTRVYATVTAVAPMGIGSPNPPSTVNIAAVSTGGTILGVTVAGASSTYETPNFATQGVLHEGSTPLDASAPPLVLSPGQYQLQVHYLVTYDAKCTLQYGPVALTYILLSGSFDTIFADGFA